MRFREFEASNSQITAKNKRQQSVFNPISNNVILNNEQRVLFEIPGNIKLELYENPADEKPRVQGNKRLRKQKKNKKGTIWL